MPPERMPARRAHAAPRRKLGFPQLVAAISRECEAAGAADAVDRRRMLARLCAEFEADEKMLLLRGFDRAYRLVIEGL